MRSLSKTLPTLAASLLVGSGVLATASEAPAVEVETAAPAAAETIFTFKGRGWGHGVGMSQWGARGRALAGWSAPRILRHYYRNTRISRGPNGAVRVLIGTSRKRLIVEGTTAWQVIDEGRAPRRAWRLRKDRRYTLEKSGSKIVLRGDGRLVARMGGAVRLQPRAASGYLRIHGAPLEGGSRYRGAIRLHRRPSGMEVVNQISLEKYLLGVVPREVPNRWGRDAPAAVEAQAIAARTYALATRKSRGTYDLYADTRSQVYGGVDAESVETTRAVNRTRRRIVTFRGRPITAFFFSTSGGRTENNENVFVGPALPYLRSVPDRFDRVSPLHRWSDLPVFTGKELAKRLSLPSPVTQMKVTKRGRSPRVLTAVAITGSGRTTFTGRDLRAKLELDDTWFTPVRSRR